MSDDPTLDALESELIRPGDEVYSSDGERIGTVREVAADRFALALEVLADPALSVPLDEVETAGGGRVELAIPAQMIGAMDWEAWPDET